MTADPRKNTEIKDEDLEQVAGGIKGDIDRPDGSGDEPVCDCEKPRTFDKRSTEQI